MEPFDVACPQCTKTLRVALEELVGRRVKCPACQTRFRIERPTGARSEVGIGMEELAGVGSGAARGSGSHSGASNFFAALGERQAEVEDIEVDDSQDAPAFTPKPSLPKKGSSKPAATPAGADSPGAEPEQSQAASAAERPSWMPYVIGVGAPLLVGLIAAGWILNEKGYLRYFGGKGLPRQDGSAFAEFSRSAVKDVEWTGLPPTAELDRVANRLKSAEKDHPKLSSNIKALRKRFDDARSKNSRGKLSNTATVSALQAIEADLRKLLRDADAP